MSTSSDADGFTLSARSAEYGLTLSERSAENGFTLVELMVALLIFAMIAAAGVSLLNFSIRAQAAAASRLDEVASDRRMVALLTADFAQALPRIARDTTGANLPAFTGNNGVGRAPILRYVRGGWSNPSGVARASIQRVEIALAGDRLQRISFPMTDGAAADAPQTLATGVESVAMRYRYKGPWSEAWVAPTADALPRAVEMTVKRRGKPAIAMLFLVGAGQ